MSHTAGEQRGADGRQRGSERDATAARTTEPRDALQQRDESGQRDRDAHPDHRSRWRPRFATLVAFALVALVTAPLFAGDGGPSQLSIGTAALLGVVQGITEFLPISSDGHLALGQALLGLDPASAGHRFTIAVHAGTLLAVVITYRRDLVDLARAALRPAESSETRHLLLAMIVASAPLGLVLLPGVEDGVIAMESEIRLVGLALWATAIALWLGFRHDRVHGPASCPRCGKR